MVMINGVTIKQISVEFDIVDKNMAKYATLWKACLVKQYEPHVFTLHRLLTNI